MEPFTDLRRLARRRTTALAGEIPGALRGDGEGVHQARVASRRLREFLPLVSVGADQALRVRRLRRKVRRLTRALGVVRELDVSLLALGEIAQREPRHAGIIARVSAALATEHAAAFVSMRQTFEDADLDALLKQVREVAASSASPDGRRLAAGVLASRLDDRVQRVRQTVDAAGTVYAPDRLHQVRIALKKLRYALELATSLGRFRLAGTLRRLKQLQDVLGTQHDLAVLAGRVRDGGPDAADAESQAGFAALARELDEAIRTQHGEFLRGRASLEAVFRWAEHVCRVLEARAVLMRGPAAPSSGAAGDAGSST
jgi:CHAD domain-containing protein